MSDELVFKKVCGPKDGELDLLFIHGLMGDPEESWTCENSTESAGKYWPCWFCKDFPQVCVYVLGYPASIFGKCAKKEMNLYERAENALDCMVSSGLGGRPLGFITHSLGGLLCKQMLRTARDSAAKDWNAIFTNTRLVAFIAVPHTGASLASTLTFSIPRFTSSHVDTLSNDGGSLDDLNSAYRDFAPAAGIKTVAYYEKWKTKHLALSALIVDKHSADPGISGTRAVALDADHKSICKPANKESVIHRSLRYHIETILKSESLSGAVSIFDVDDHSERSTSDRRDLLEKLIAARREHEYQQGNELQNKFAQHYYRLGLHTEARRRNDQLLSEVKQRFQVHVYHGKICKGATQDEIDDALQSEVIDAVSSKYSGNPNFSAMTVLTAIYFLTEQCHIRWDAP